MALTAAKSHKIVAESTTRRAFAKTVASAALTSAVAGPVMVAAQDQPRAKAIEVATEALTLMIRTRHQRQLAPEQVLEIRRGIYRNLRIADNMKKHKLTNSDAPAVIFHPGVP